METKEEQREAQGSSKKALPEHGGAFPEASPLSLSILSSYWYEGVRGDGSFLLARSTPIVAADWGALLGPWDILPRSKKKKKK